MYRKRFHVWRGEIFDHRETKTLVVDLNARIIGPGVHANGTQSILPGVVDAPRHDFREKPLPLLNGVHNDAVEVKGVALIAMPPDNFVRVGHAKYHGHHRINDQFILIFVFNVSYERVLS